MPLEVGRPASVWWGISQSGGSFTWRWLAAGTSLWSGAECDRRWPRFTCAGAIIRGGGRAAPGDSPPDPTIPRPTITGRLALEDKKPAEAADHFSKTVLLRPDLESAYYYLHWRRSS